MLRVSHFPLELLYAVLWFLELHFIVKVFKYLLATKLI